MSTCPGMMCRLRPSRRQIAAVFGVTIAIHWAYVAMQTPEGTVGGSENTLNKPGMHEKERRDRFVSDVEIRAAPAYHRQPPPQPSLNDQDNRHDQGGQQTPHDNHNQGHPNPRWDVAVRSTTQQKTAETVTDLVTTVIADARRTAFTAPPDGAARAAQQANNSLDTITEVMVPIEPVPAWDGFTCTSRVKEAKEVAVARLGGCSQYVPSTNAPILLRHPPEGHACCHPRVNPDPS